MHQWSTLEEAVSSSSNPIILMQRILSHVLEMVPGADGAAIELLQPDGLLACVCASGMLSRRIGLTFAPLGSQAGAAIELGSTVLSNDTTLDSQVNHNLTQRLRVVSLASVPLRSHQGIIGVLQVSSSAKGALGDDDIHFLAGLTEFMSANISAGLEIDRVTKSVLRASRADEKANKEEADKKRDKDLPVVDISRGPAPRSSTAFMASILAPGAQMDMEARLRIEGVLDGHIDMLFQPIIEIRTGDLLGVEALSRFPSIPERPPDVWFAEAHDAGLGLQLELAAVSDAIGMLKYLPESLMMAINVGPDSVGSSALLEILEDVHPDRIVLEITEHIRIDDYASLNSRINRLRDAGVRLAIDDTGTGYSSLAHILKLRPDFIKLDRFLTAGIDSDPAKRALAACLVSFAADTGAEIIAEGVETSSELATLSTLNVRYGQGFYLGRPVGLDGSSKLVGPEG